MSRWTPSAERQPRHCFLPCARPARWSRSPPSPEAPPQEHRLWVKPLIMRPSAGQLARISELVASGAVRVEIEHQLGLSDVQRAHAVSESGHARGKIVLTVRSPSRWCPGSSVSFVLIKNTTQEGAQRCMHAEQLQQREPPAGSVITSLTCWRRGHDVVAISRPSASTS